MINNRNTLQEFLEKSIVIHGTKYDYSKSVYNGLKEKLIIICPKHGEFIQSADSHMLGNGCRKCHESKGERTIRLFLERQGIDYEQQKKFDTCKGIAKRPTKLPFDFYIPIINTLIEYDGQLHYEPWSNKIENIEKLHSIQRNDSIKSKWCQDNNVPFIRIKYTEVLENYLQKILHLVQDQNKV